MPSSVTQLWTPARATSALPLLRRIADDLVRAYAEWRDLVGRFELASVAAAPGRANAEAEQLQKDVMRAAAEIEGFMQELAELGVECKSPETGLFDFPSERDGRPVYLCWMRGERAVSHWHDLEAGFAGRQPLE
jgi:hypothetical protein